MRRAKPMTGVAMVILTQGAPAELSEQLIVAGAMFGGLLAAVPGWLAWTGRYRGWGRRGGLIDAWTPMFLFLGVGWILMFASFLLASFTYPDEPPVGRAIGVSLFLAGLGLMFWGMVGMIVTMGPAATYRRKPNGTWVTRLFLPRWYHEYLRDRFGGRPRERPPAPPPSPSPPPPSPPPPSPPR